LFIIISIVIAIIFIIFSGPWYYIRARSSIRIRYT